MLLIVIQGLAILTMLACLLILPFCNIRYSRFSGEAAAKIRQCQKELEAMYEV